MHRRQLLKTSVLSLGTLSIVSELHAAPAEPAGSTKDTSIRLCLNTSTISGQKLTMPQQVEVCAKAGYQGIEPWIRDLRQYIEGGGSLKDLRKSIEDEGLTVESAIGFARWIVDNEDERKAGLEKHVATWR